MTDPARHPELPHLSFSWPKGPPPEDVVTREWLVTNGLGSYAAGTLAGVNTRRYHGLFTPSLPAPYGRTVMLPRMMEHARVGNRRIRLDGEERLDGELICPELQYLRGFRLRGLLPEWDFDVDGSLLRRRLVLVHGENTLFYAWEHLGGPELVLELRPFVTFRHHDRPIPAPGPPPLVKLRGEQVEIDPVDDVPPLRLRAYAPCPIPFVSLPESSPPLLYRVERARGLDHVERQTSPGFFECCLQPGGMIALGVTTNGWDSLERSPTEAFELELERERRILERAPASTRTGTGARLVLAADQFVIEPVTRPQDEAWARATGQAARSVIAGYHWFTDWGRDTMISLEGLALCTGRLHEAAAILRTFQHYVRDGLLPNLFPEGGREGLYHTSDATLWFFHAIERYLDVSGDLELLRDLHPTLVDIVDRHLAGTRFGIGVDPADGLLRQGAEGYQLTWMDAKVDGWVVTPRRGKAVEINALWFNALRLMADWAIKLGHDPARYHALAEAVQTSFNRRFWNDATGCLWDVVDGESENDGAIRPNQIFAISLPHPVLRRDRWLPVLHRVESELVTPVGLRSLSPGHPDYKPKYDGDLRARDAAYHQGTVWAWLIGHYVDAHLKCYGDKVGSRSWLAGLEDHLRGACVGQVSEIFDANGPYRPRGCVAQAWSVAELLRAWLKTI